MSPPFVVILSPRVVSYIFCASFRRRCPSSRVSDCTRRGGEPVLLGGVSRTIAETSTTLDRGRGLVGRVLRVGKTRRLIIDLRFRGDRVGEVSDESRPSLVNLTGREALPD